MQKFISKNRCLIIFVGVIFCVSLCCSRVVELSVSRFNGVTIVLDAGHGGRDGGSVGVNGTIEKDINLDYVLTLKEKLVKNGFRVVLTRKNEDGLYSPLSKNKKRSDMNERLRIIKQANPNLVLSVHMNSFVTSMAKGASTYYRKGDSASKSCGDMIQKSLFANCGAKQSQSKVGDYFMINSSYYTAVLVECGFLSNPDEEKLLNSKDYKNKVVDAIYEGILLYFGNSSI